MPDVPRRGDRMFLPVNAVKWSGMDFHKFIGFRRAYVIGFKQAADSLLQLVLESPSTTLDERVIPACHLYRHYVELHLKFILCEGRATRYISFKDVDIVNHNLWQLWQAARKLMLLAVPQEPAETLSAVDLLVKDLHESDCSGQESRYHQTRQGAESLKNLPNLYDLRNQMQMMAKLEAYFDEWVLLFQCQFEDPDFQPPTPPLDLFPHTVQEQAALN